MATAASDRLLEANSLLTVHRDAKIGGDDDAQQEIGSGRSIVEEDTDEESLLLAASHIIPDFQQPTYCSDGAERAQLAQVAPSQGCGKGGITRIADIVVAHVELF